MWTLLYVHTINTTVAGNRCIDWQRWHWRLRAPWRHTVSEHAHLSVMKHFRRRCKCDARMKCWLVWSPVTLLGPDTGRHAWLTSPLPLSACTTTWYLWIVVERDHMARSFESIYYFTPDIGLRSIAISVSACLSVCLSVCLYARISRKQHILISPNFLNVLYMRSWLGPPLTVTKSYVLPVLWMTLFHVMEGIGRTRGDAYVSPSSTSDINWAKSTVSDCSLFSIWWWKM